MGVGDVGGLDDSFVGVVDRELALAVPVSVRDRVVPVVDTEGESHSVGNDPAFGCGGRNRPVGEYSGYT